MRSSPSSIHCKRLMCMPNLSRRIDSFVNATTFQNTIMALIMINAVVIGLDTYPGIRAEYGPLLSGIDQFIIWIFVVEITLRWISWSPRYMFLANGWNLFDFLIISVALLPTAPYFSIIRIFRVLRVLRAFRFIPGMSHLIVALLKSLPSLGHILFLTLILFYVYAVIGTSLYSEGSPKFFGSLHISLLTLFQIATLEGWPDILTSISKTSPKAWIYMLSFILMGTFVVLNLVVGVIVNNLQMATQDPSEKLTFHQETRKELSEIKNTLDRLEKRLGGKL